MAGRICVLLAAVALWLALGTAAASAHSHYTFTRSFGTAGSGSGELSLVAGTGRSAGSGIAVNSATHDVYVADTANNRVDQFTAEGAFVRAWGWGVETGAEELQTCTAACRQGLAGQGAGEMHAPAFVAVDNSSGGGGGDVYVANTGAPLESPENIVSKFGPNGELIATWGMNGQLAGSGTPEGLFGQLQGIAVDTVGNLWVYAESTLQQKIPRHQYMYEFEQDGAFMQRWVPSEGGEVAQGIAVDAVGGPTSDELYIPAYGGDEIRRYTAGGAVGEHGERLTSRPDGFEDPTNGFFTGIAADPVGHEIYLDTDPGTIMRFSSSCRSGEAPANNCIPLESVGFPQSVGGGALAVDSGTGAFYVVKPGADAIAAFAPEVPEPPTIEDAFVTDVTSSGATLSTTVNPDGPATSYLFEYGSTTSYGESAPAGGGAVGSGFVGQGISVHVQGLLANTPYHFRIAASNEKGTVFSEDRTFTTQAAAGSFSLADGRQWELVSAPNKLGALIEASEDTNDLTQAAADGDAVSYQATSPTEREPQGFAVAETVLSTRGVQGWSSQDISAPNIRATRASSGVGHEFEIFSEDLSLAAIQPQERVFTPLSPEASETTPYLRTDYAAGNVENFCSSSCYRPLVTGKEGFANVPAGTIFGEESNGVCEVPVSLTCGPLFQGASPDMSHIVLSSPAQLTETPAPAGGPGLYEWSDGSLQLLDVLPAGEEGPAVLAGSNSHAHSGVRDSVSADGERVILEGGATGGKSLYLRDVAARETVRLDVPQGGSGPSKEVAYMDASDDASRIFFLDGGPLTPGSSPSGADLYEYDLNAPAGSRLSDLTVDANAGQSADVITVIAASKDGSYVYFVAGGALTPDATPRDCSGTGQSGGCNLYVRHEGVTRLVAALSSEDLYDWKAESFTLHVRARVSPNGRWLAFMSAAELTGADTHDAVTGKPDQEVYLYDASADRLECASCNPTGARPVGAFIARPTGPEQVAASVPPWTGSPDPGAFGGSYASHQPRYLSDSGRLFFDSTDSLVAQDVDGVEDVYEYEPAGVGGCSSSSATFAARSGGCVNLVSAGSSPAASRFMDASESGGDVFFLTQSRLAAQDYDTVYDVYDAHECTAAAPCLPVVAQPPACTSESSCRAAPTPQPSLYGAPASATFSGAGDPAPSTPAISPRKAVKRATRCKKRLVRNAKGRCVKQKGSTRARRAVHKRRAGR